jgi:tetratricopeptide (TPR) repeat protein
MPQTSLSLDVLIKLFIHNSFCFQKFKHDESSNLGDVIEEEGKLFGDGVNIAARLESLSEAGGICISGTAYDHVENKLLQKAIALDDGHASVHSNLGVLYTITREYDKALAEGERAIALNPSGAEVHVHYGIILTSVGRAEEAIPMFQKAIRLNPFGPAGYHSNFGNALRNMGRFEEAISAYKKALQLSPDHFWAHVGLSATYSRMGREKEARAEFAEVKRINPKY